jgi:hypothetical protein
MVTKSKNGKRIGRPTKLTPALQKQICGFIEKGNYISTACAACGIDERTYQRWVEWGKKGTEPYATFVVSIKKAEVIAETARVERIQEAGIGGKLIKVTTRTLRNGTEVKEEFYSQPQWPADMTILERRHPERWGRRQEITGKGGGPVVFKVVTDDDPPTPKPPENGEN